MVTDREYALLSAWANSPMLGDLGGGGQVAQNFLAVQSPFVPNGWTVQEVTLARIQSQVNTAVGGSMPIKTLTQGDLAGMAAFVFTRSGETVIAFRGTQMDEGLILGPGREDEVLYSG